MNKSIHPVSNVVWIEASRIKTNDYNPNSQIDDNHRLLVESIDKDGWTQPIVVRPPDEKDRYVIIDGEHRYRAALKLKHDEVPVVILDQNKAKCIASTVRHNRARGTHSVESMYKIVKGLSTDGFNNKQIGTMLGMKSDELERLMQSEEAFLIIASGGDRSMNV